LPLPNRASAIATQGLGIISNAPIVGNELDLVTFGIGEEEGSPMEFGELFWEDIDSEFLQPTPLVVVVVQVDQKREVVERRCGRIDFGSPIE
jgi:hypothetical protein